MPHSLIDLPQLGVNLDHIATLRQLRGTPYPDLQIATELAVLGGANQITIHLREDRRHIHDRDISSIQEVLRKITNGTIPLNLEMAATDEMLRIAKNNRPRWVCLVPEKRQELTTEGGLLLAPKSEKRIRKTIDGLKKSGINVSLFVEPSAQAVKTSREWGADAVELHTGKYCLQAQKGKPIERLLKQIELAATAGTLAGLRVHAGHGFDYQNVRPVAALMLHGKPLIQEFNIGHSIVCRAALVGLERSVREMKSAILAP